MDERPSPSRKGDHSVKTSPSQAATTPAMTPRLGCGVEPSRSKIVPDFLREEKNTVKL
jgi:hypothetical protein